MEGLERKIHIFETEIADRPLKVEIGKVATLASGSCLISYGDTMVLVAVTASAKPKTGIDFFPLSVDFEEKQYAVGKIPGGFIKREGRPSEKAVLTSRLIDRPIRPLFPDGYFNEVQVIAQVLSVEQDNSPDMVAMLGASIALSISDIPFDGPIAGVTVGYVNGEYVINPTVVQTEASDLHLIVAGTDDAINMVEAGANILPEAVVLEALLKGHDEIKRLCAFVSDIQAQIGKEKSVVPALPTNEALDADIESFAGRMNELVRIPGKKERGYAIDALKEEIVAELSEKYPEDADRLKGLLKGLEKRVMRAMILNEKVRPDGRKPDEIRPITVETGLIPRTHGSGLFTRGLTQALTITTLGALGEAQRIDGLGLEETKRYMHHYNFPPYSVGETGFMRGPNRRAIGHGALGERALVPVLPTEEAFPYAIRLVSEVVTCNGSSSQASICGSSLSLMDAGVPISAPVAGIAMGMVEEKGELTILSDIQGVEDFLGDMDFKVAGTTEGITAMQMDIKIEGLSRDILVRAMEQARVGRLHILAEMAKVIDAPRAEMSDYAPRVHSLRIKPDKIRDVIGPGGKIINKIIDETGVKIDIDDTGLVLITAPDGPSGQRAKDMIVGITKDVEVGEVYTAKISRIMKFGAFADLGNGKEGLVHISQLTKDRLANVEDKFKIGDEIQVKIIEIDKQGRINLSRKVLLQDEK
ncbi:MULTISPECIES: polyribonucleotide nucleotidyltransferase [unclassified Fusibacter]|uniref:polyribonucleotide nucleotidyltransferase n=1 Tax=unclassified Fusibacter TaxID=2624464 RepID=UPI001011E0A5|nr:MULTISPECIES: polyribonucleotide nucleotidyltransferase [unclassified Fusibacter]MCK8058809.1 polyribonucleotide nucleotidyltransferase [Fusibacter sp. A2]NPE21883.1 polyribonucleotide nucleotidyltransferase [Fusibacter sp. A1]RXV61455.1 polyribonucleotide nucleotidyltransferase [Fusibacter sp. A1]